MSGIFKSKTSEPQINTVYDFFSRLRSKVSDYLSGQVGQPAKPYTGDLVAPASAAENQSQSTLQDYASAPNTGEGFKLAKDEYAKTLSGDYDPSTSPYYQATKAAAMRNNDLAQQSVANNASMGRRYYGGGRLREQGDVAAQTTNSLNSTLGSMALQERQNRLTADPYAAALDQAEKQIPLQKTAALQTYGALPREIQQAYNDALYNEFLSSTREYPLNVAQISSSLAAQQPIFSKTNAPVKSGGLDFLSQLFRSM